MRTAALCLFLLLSSACVVGVRAPVPPPPPPPPAAPAPAPLSRQEAVDIAIHAAEERGIEGGRVHHTQLQHGVWRIDLRAAPPLKGAFKVRVDAWSGAIVRIDDHVKRHPGHGHGHGRDDDDDDDE